MAFEGSLRDMDLTHLVDLARERAGPVAIYVETPAGTYRLFVDQGRVVHIQGPKTRDAQALAELLAQQEGRFRLVEGEAPPEVTIEQPWNTLLLETLKTLDEGTTPSEEEITMERPKKLRERITEVLENLIAESSDILGAAVVGIDGLIYSAHIPVRGIDEQLVAAVTAAIYGLSKRSIQQLQEGEFRQTLIQGSNGYILVRSITPQTIFVGLLPGEANLGMAFAEARTATAQLAELLRPLQ